MAAGIVPLAHGNDIAGSVRFPAYACGVAGLRPSFGRVPAFNPTATAERPPSSQLLSVQGPIARSVARSASGAARHGRARSRATPGGCRRRSRGPPPRRPLRVALVTEPADLCGARLHPTVADAMQRAAGWLASAGYEIVEAKTPGFTRATELWFAMQVPEIRVYLSPLIEQHGDRGIRGPWD